MLNSFKLNAELII